MALQFQPYGTAVPALRHCSSSPTALEFHPYGTGGSPTRECRGPRLAQLYTYHIVSAMLKCIIREEFGYL